MCSKCGGPKPKGRGRRLCEDCSVHCDQHNSMTGSCAACRKLWLDANPERRAELNNDQKVYRYGPEAEQYLDAERCQVCGSTWKLCIDHDHETGKVRGVLCGNCNSALGFVKDNIETLQGLVTYLGYFKGERF